MTKRTTQKILLVAGVLALGLPGCGSTPVSAELVDARDVVNQAVRGPANELEPDEVRRADRTLARAERAPDGSAEERHFAYLADRQARIAIAHAETARTQQALEADQERYQEDLEETAVDQSQQLEARQDELARTREALEDVRAELSERGEQLDERTEELQAREQELSARVDELMQAREARAAAEQRAAQAMNELREMAEIREEQEQWVITLNGEVLFETGESELRGTATRRLRAVAEALNQSEDTSIVIEGHTDSRGSDADNRELSRARAAAVRDFLVAHEVDSSRVEIIGRGEAEPVADNDTPEGRANNRRVEIHVERAS